MRSSLYGIGSEMKLAQQPARANRFGASCGATVARNSPRECARSGPVWRLEFRDGDIRLAAWPEADQTRFRNRAYRPHIAARGPRDYSKSVERDHRSAWRAPGGLSPPYQPGSAC